MNKTKIIGDRALLQENKADKVINGIILTNDSLSQKTYTIVKLGNGRLTEQGTIYRTNPLKEGDTVIIAPNGGLNVEIDDEKYKLVNCSDIFIVL